MELEEVFATVLGVAANELNDATRPQVLADWTSRRHIELITAMESVYGVTFSTAEIKGLKSLGTARDLLREKGIALPARR